MKCRYDPKYASQYKSKHTKHVKLSKKSHFSVRHPKVVPQPWMPPQVECEECFTKYC